jgi:menaquinol-cytochrome c reductase iron-sulfur subunit
MNISSLISFRSYMKTLDNAGATRRTLFVRAICGIWAVIGAGLGAPAAAYLLLGPKTRKNDDWFEVGDLTELAAGQPVEMAFRRIRADAWKVVSEKVTAWVVKRRDGSVVAFDPQCTHLGCAYHWEERKSQFVCPCHNSLFSIDGKVLGGPAARPLVRYEVKVEGDKVLVSGPRQSLEVT